MSVGQKRDDVTLAGGSVEKSSLREHVHRLTGPPDVAQGRDVSPSAETDGLYAWSVGVGDAVDVVADVRVGPRDVRTSAAQVASDITETLTGRSRALLYRRRLLPVCLSSGTVKIVVTVRGVIDQTREDRIRLRGVELLVIHVQFRPGILKPREKCLNELIFVVEPRSQPTNTVREASVGETLDQIRTLTFVERSDPRLIQPGWGRHNIDL